MRKTPFSEAVSEEDLSRMGITAYGDISISDLVFSETVRHICEGNQCRNYGKTWACPPAVGTLAECRSKCYEYSRAFIFASTYKLEVNKIAARWPAKAVAQFFTFSKKGSDRIIPR